MQVLKNMTSKLDSASLALMLSLRSFNEKLLDWWIMVLAPFGTSKDTFTTHDTKAEKPKAKRAKKEKADGK